MARQAAEEASRATSRMLSTLSHEMRTPLNAIAGYTQLLGAGVRGPVTPAQVEDLQRIRQSQLHLTGVVNSVLRHAKLEHVMPARPTSTTCRWPTCARRWSRS